MREVYSFYFDAFWIAVKSILEHKLRAFLTLIGIIIGVAAVMVVAASISGLKTYVVDKVGKVLGSNHFMITRMASTGRMSDEEFERKNRNNKDVIWSEYLYVKENCKIVCMSELRSELTLMSATMALRCRRSRSSARPTICTR
ncbi:MAG: ABC transporter permease [Acidobacteria bacterium]|nr:ABC transporter permease [Acidobacteriota bacterium]